MERKKIIFKTPSKSIPIPGDKNPSQPLQTQTDIDANKYHYIPKPLQEPQAPPQGQIAPPPTPPQVPQPPKVVAAQHLPPPPPLPPRPVQSTQATVPPPPQAPQGQMKLIQNNKGQGVSTPQTQQNISLPPPNNMTTNPGLNSELAAKTSVQKGKLINQPENDDTAEMYKEQLQNYLELCDSISSSDWTMEGIIDVFYVMIESLELDSVAMALIDFKQKKTLLPVVSRGFSNLPGENISAAWNEAITEGPTISWNKLMVIASGGQNALARWIQKEGLDSIGYVPIHDNKTIFGFIFIGSHDNAKKQSRIASPLLELCGGRIGLTIALRKFQGTWN